MYSIQSVPITNNNQQSFPNKSHIRERLAQKLAFDWLLPKQTCLFFDIIGRQLIKKSVAPIEYANGLSNLRVQLLTIDAHCFSCLLSSLMVNDQDATCRNCACQEKLIFMLHTVALEGSNRYVYSIVDYICTTCAKDVCAKELRACSQRNDQLNMARWVRTFATLQKTIQDVNNAVLLNTSDLQMLLILMSNTVGPAICPMQQFIDMFVQEKFAAQQINLLTPQNSTAATVEVISLSYVKSFLTCSCCNQSVINDDVKLGVMSTVYYDSARVFAVPYYVCSRPECSKKWQQDSFSQQRFAKLLSLHQFSMRECFRQSLQFLYFICPKLLGIEHSEFLNKWDIDEVAEENKNTSSLLLTVESDMLNKLFNLDKQQTNATKVVQRLVSLCDDPCVPKLDRCVKRCLCKACVGKNLLFVDILQQFKETRDKINQQSIDDLDNIVDSFSQLCLTGQLVKPKIATVNHNRCHMNSIDSVSCYTQDIENQFRHWRLKPNRRTHVEKPRCGQTYAQELLSNDKMDQFFNDTSTFMSQMF